MMQPQLAPVAAQQLAAAAQQGLRHYSPSGCEGTIVPEAEGCVSLALVRWAEECM